jgi:dienelactone hydrolase/DNA-directed RNA polymerase subunit RPC12/RpoP
MSIVVACRCGQKFAAQPHLAGKQVACPVCGQALLVPRQSTAPAAARGGVAAGKKIPVACRCGRQFLAEPHLAGQRVGCPNCGQPISIPASASPAASASAGIDLAADPLADAVAMQARAPAARRTGAPSLVRSSPARKKKPFNPRPFIVGGLIAGAAVLVLGLGVAGFYGIRGLVRSIGGSSGGSGWQEYTSTDGRFSVQFPSGMFSRKIDERRPQAGLTLHVEGVRLMDGREAGIAHAPLNVPMDEATFLNLTAQELSRQKPLRRQQDLQVQGHPAKELEYEIAGADVVSRFFLADGRFYEVTWGARRGKLKPEDYQKFFDSFRLLGADGAAASPGAPSPTGGVAKSPAQPAAADYAAARRSFQTKLTRRSGSPQESEPLRTPPGAQRISYSSGGLSLAAFVDSAPADGQKRPGLLFLHGGFAFGDGDWEMAQPYRDAGYVVLIPALRGENGQAGNFSLYFDEVDDVLAAADALAKLPYVDPQRIFVAGHSAGGTLAALAAMASNRFKAAAALCGCMDQRLNADMAPFDTNDDGEFRIRSPLDFAASFQCPTRLYFGSQEAWALTSTRNTATQAKAKGLDVEAISVPGDHFTAVDPAIRQSVVFFRQHGGGGPALPAAASPADNPFLPTPPSSPPSIQPPDFPRTPPPFRPRFGPPGRSTAPGVRPAG